MKNRKATSAVEKFQKIIIVKKYLKRARSRVGYRNIFEFIIN